MTTVATATALSLDAWLGEQLGCDAYRLVIAAGEAGVVDAEAAIAELAAISSRSLFSWTRVPVAEVAVVHALESAGFRIADTSVTLECDADRLQACVPATGVAVRAACPADEERVAALAGDAFEFSRFHQDPLISRLAADAIKAAWARNYFHGRRGDAMVVAECAEAGTARIAGFLLAIAPAGSDALTIDLVAVDARYRGRAIAAAMTSFANSSLAAVRRIRVGTQLANLPALRCYQRLGFQIVGADYMLHYHRSN